MLLKPYSVCKTAQDSQSHLQIPESHGQDFRTFSDEKVYHPMTLPESEDVLQQNKTKKESKKG